MLFKVTLGVCYIGVLAKIMAIRIMYLLSWFKIEQHKKTELRINPARQHRRQEDDKLTIYPYSGDNSVNNVDPLIPSIGYEGSGFPTGSCTHVPVPGYENQVQPTISVILHCEDESACVKITPRLLNAEHTTEDIHLEHLKYAVIIMGSTSAILQQKYELN